MATEADKVIQQPDGANGVAAGVPNGLGDKTLVENTTAEKAAAEPSPVEVPVPAPAKNDTVAPPAPAPPTEAVKPSEAVPPAPVVAAPAPAAEESKVDDEVVKPAEQVAPVQAETSTKAPPASAPLEASSDFAPTEEKPLEIPAASTISADDVSEALKPNGTTTNGTTTVSKEQEDIEMKEAPTAPSTADLAAAPTPAPADPNPDSAAVDRPAKEPEVGAVAGKKRKAADDGPVVHEAVVENKKAKIEEATASEKVASTTADPVPAPTTETVNTEVSLDGAPAPKKAGRPKKTQKEKVPVSPVGRTLRKTRSQGPVEV